MNRIVALAALALAIGCDATGPSRPRWASLAFGDDIVWITKDSVRPGIANPLVIDDVVYYADGAGILNGRLVALDRNSGAQKWTSEIDGVQHLVGAGPYVGVLNSQLVILHKVLGTEISRVTAVPSMAGNLASDGTRFFITSHNSGSAIAIDPVGGTVPWSTKLSGPATGTHGRGVIVSGDRVIATFRFNRPFLSTTVSDTGIVAAVNKATGAILWRRAMDSTAARDPFITGPAVVSGNNTVVGTERHQLVALSLVTGIEQWRYGSASNPQSGSQGLAACDGRVFAPAATGLVAVSAETGAELWKVSSVNDASLWWIQCSHGTVMTMGVRLNLFDAATGTRLVSYPRDPGNAVDFHALEDLQLRGAVRDETGIYLSTNWGFVKLKAP